jgi:hypothetical protein
VTELIDAEVAVRTGAGGEVTAVQIDGRWLELERVAARWRVETDWWRAPVRRDYWRCLLRDQGAGREHGAGGERGGGDCIEVCFDHARGRWTLVRRYD